MLTVYRYFAYGMGLILLCLSLLQDGHAAVPRGGGRGISAFRSLRLAKGSPKGLPAGGLKASGMLPRSVVGASLPQNPFKKISRSHFGSFKADSAKPGSASAGIGKKGSTGKGPSFFHTRSNPLHTMNERLIQEAAHTFASEPKSSNGVSASVPLPPTGSELHAGGDTGHVEKVAIIHDASQPESGVTDAGRNGPLHDMNIHHEMPSTTATEQNEVASISIEPTREAQEIIAHGRVGHSRTEEIPRADTDVDAAYREYEGSGSYEDHHEPVTNSDMSEITYEVSPEYHPAPHDNRAEYNESRTAYNRVEIPDYSKIYEGSYTEKVDPVKVQQREEPNVTSITASGVAGKERVMPLSTKKEQEAPAVAPEAYEGSGSYEVHQDPVQRATKPIAPSLKKEDTKKGAEAEEIKPYVNDINSRPHTMSPPRESSLPSTTSLARKVDDTSYKKEKEKSDDAVKVPAAALPQQHDSSTVTPEESGPSADEGIPYGAYGSNDSSRFVYPSYEGHVSASDRHPLAQDIPSSFEYRSQKAPTGAFMYPWLTQDCAPRRSYDSVAVVQPLLTEPSVEIHPSSVASSITPTNKPSFPQNGPIISNWNSYGLAAFYALLSLMSLLGCVYVPRWVRSRRAYKVSS